MGTVSKRERTPSLRWIRSWIRRTVALLGESDRMRRLAPIAYVVFGIVVASQHNYFVDLTTVSQVVSAVVATALWPLILLGANLHLSLGHL